MFEENASSELKILLIDDHPFFLDGLSLGLTQLGSQAVVVDSLSDANSALSLGSKIESYDLVLCDLNLPRLNGIQFIQRLIQNETYVRVAIVSASENESDVENALRVGAAGFINKGLKLAEFQSALQAIIGGTRYVPPVLKRDTANKPIDIQALVSELNITERQFEVLILLSDGLSNLEISQQLGIKESTVKSHLQVLFQVFNVANRTACLVKAREMGLLAEGSLI